MQWVSYWTFTTFFSYNAKKYSDDEIGILKKSYGNLINIAIYRHTNDVQNISLINDLTDGNGFVFENYKLGDHDGRGVIQYNKARMALW